MTKAKKRKSETMKGRAIVACLLCVLDAAAQEQAPMDSVENKEKKPGLMERLRELGFTPRSKIFSRAQVKAIFEALGEP
jgi:hypothetical protein